jgi:hypothetical protein
MTIKLILEAVIAALKFPEELGNFIKLLQQAPEQRRQEINTQVGLWMKESASSDDGRPKWENP